MLPHGGDKERRERTCNLEDRDRIAWSHLIPRLSSPLHSCACGSNGSTPGAQKAASASPQSGRMLTAVILQGLPPRVSASRQLARMPSVDLGQRARHGSLSGRMLRLTPDGQNSWQLGDTPRSPLRC